MQEEIQQLQDSVRQLETRLVDTEAQNTLLRQTSFHVGAIQYITDATVLANKLATTPESFLQHIFIDGINNRFYVYGVSWKYTNVL